METVDEDQTPPLASCGFTWRMRGELDGDAGPDPERFVRFSAPTSRCPTAEGKAERFADIVQPGSRRLEHDIDRPEMARLAPLTSFVLPGGTPAAAYLHLARTICRRAETDDGGTRGPSPNETGQPMPRSSI